MPKRLFYTAGLFFFTYFALFGEENIPPWLSSIPLSDATGVVISSKRIFLNGATAPYNASILKADEGYLLFFTHDDWLPKECPYPTDGMSSYTINRRIGVARLDKEFTHVERRVRFLTPPKNWKKKWKNWMDPRVFTINDTVYVMTFIFKGDSPSKNVCISTICPKTLAFSDPQNIHTQSDQMERNWVPLISKETNPKKLSFLYALYPTVVRTMDLIKRRAPSSGQSFKASFPQGWKWGNLLGGTPAILTGDCYLTFFHSHFQIKVAPNSSQGPAAGNIYSRQGTKPLSLSKQSYLVPSAHSLKGNRSQSWDWLKTPNEKRCYVMGACTFSKDAPHRLLSISPYPILFDQIYTSKVDGKMGPLGDPPWTPFLDRVIFPCGFVCDRDETGREVIHVSCGENDVGTRIVTIDKKKLLESLVKVS